MSDAAEVRECERPMFRQANQLDARRYFDRAVVKLVAATQPHEKHMVRVTAIDELRHGNDDRDSEDCDPPLVVEVRIEGRNEAGHPVYVFFPGDVSTFVDRLLGRDEGGEAK